VNEKPMRFKFVFFDLPYLIFVKDSMDDPDLRAWAEAFQSGVRPLPYSPYAPHSERPGGHTIGGGFPVYLPPKDLGNFYLVSLDQAQVGIRMLRRVNPHRSVTLMGEMPGDRAGRASFSSVKAMFDLQSMKPEYHGKVVDLAIEAINKFISHYRVIANRPYVQPVTPGVIQEFQIQTRFEDGTSQTTEFRTASGVLHGMGGSIPDDQDRALRVALAKDLPPIIYASLDADIRDHLDLRKSRLALIETAVLFEAWLSNFVREQYANQGLPRSQIEAKFVGPR
jgi:hypothetical protein